MNSLLCNSILPTYHAPNKSRLWIMSNPNNLLLSYRLNVLAQSDKENHFLIHYLPWPRSYELSLSETRIEHLTPSLESWIPSWSLIYLHMWFPISIHHPYTAVSHKWVGVKNIVHHIQDNMVSQVKGLSAHCHWRSPIDILRENSIRRSSRVSSVYLFPISTCTLTLVSQHKWLWDHHPPSVSR